MSSLTIAMALHLESVANCIYFYSFNPLTHGLSCRLSRLLSPRIGPPENPKGRNVFPFTLGTSFETADCSPAELVQSSLFDSNGVKLNIRASSRASIHI